MITKIIWEILSVLLLLYGLYLGYVFVWFSMFRILDMDMFTAKLISGVIALAILGYSSFNWFKKKRQQLEELEQKELES